MPATVRLELIKFKKNAFVMIEGNEIKDYFYIIRKGQVQVYMEEDSEDDASTEVLKEGDFFGVISCMSGHPSIENSVALTDVELIRVARNQFPNLIQNNTPIAMKIIRYFSKKLREYDKELSDLIGKSEEEDKEDASQIWDIAETYNNQKQFNLALYAYTRYLQYNPEGEHVQEAKNKLAKLSPLAKEAMNPQNKNGGLNRTYKDNTFVFCEHELGDELYVIQKGKIKITKVQQGKEVLIAVLPEGEIFGEMAILENKPRSASAIAYGDVQMLAVNKDNFESMVQKQPPLAVKLIELLSERIWTIYRQLDNALFVSPIARIWDTMLIQVQKQRMNIEHNSRYTFSFGPKELITMAGLPQDQGRRIIKEVMENKKLKLNEDQKIEVLDLQELQKQVQYYKKMEERERKRARDKVRNK